ncbi:MAG TPA: RNA-binding domain-containing protein [Puia sp.]|nr:RNA-binding domain-containing protein [Puia sp.]
MILLVQQFAVGELVGGTAVIPVLFFVALPIFSSLLKPNPDPAPKLVFDAKTAFAWFRACWGFFLALGGVAAIAKHEYLFGLPLMLMGLIFISPLDRILFREYKSIIPALSVRPRYDAVKVATACWWVLASVLFIIGDSDYMSKEYGEGTAFLCIGFAMMFVNPAAAMYKNWDPSKAQKWSDIKKDMANWSKEYDEKQAQKAAERKAKAAAARQEKEEAARAAKERAAKERDEKARVTPTPAPSSSVTPAKTSPPAPTSSAPSPAATTLPSSEAPSPIPLSPRDASQPPSVFPPPSPVATPPAAEPPNEYLLLIRKGESSTLEFKSTLRVDLKTQKPEKFIQHSVLKTLAAFLNSHGGTLVIGVEDNKNILGLTADFNSFSKGDKLDEFQKYLDTLLGNAIGNRFHRILDVEFPEVEGKTICVIRVKTTAGDPVYIKNEAGQELFYIRRLASTIDLQPSEAIKYIREHWP